MIENTPQNQTKFNSLYWGQPVGRVAGMPFLWKVGEGRRVNTGFEHLELKSVTLLSDGELLTLAKIRGEEIEEPLDEDEIPNQIDYYREGFKLGLLRVTSGMVDYLRYKGYAWEWMGLSVVDQVNMGWIKLKL